MVMGKRFLPFCLFTLLPLTAVAQKDDFGFDFSLEAQKKLSKEWSLSLEGEYRSRNNAKTNDRWSIGLGVDYKVAKWLKASAGYTLLYDNNEKTSYYEATDDDVIDGDAEVGDPKKCAQYWATRHRFNVSLTASQKWGNWKFSLRERWQYTYRPEKTVTRWDFDNSYWEDKVRSSRGKNQLRSRLQLEYDQKGALFTPYVNVELYNSLAIEKIRYTVGTDLNLTKQHTFSLFYRYQNMKNVDADEYDPDMHYIGVGYKFKF